MVINYFFKVMDPCLIIPHVGIFLKPINPSKYNERFPIHKKHMFLTWFSSSLDFCLLSAKNESISGFLAAGRRSNASQRNDVSHSVWNWLKRIIFVSCRKIIEIFVKFIDAILLFFIFWVKNETFFGFETLWKRLKKQNLMLP